MVPTQCTLGRHRVSILPPSCLTLTEAESGLGARRGSFAVTKKIASRVEGLAVGSQFRPDLMDWHVSSLGQKLVFQILTCWWPG